ncbi:MAG TPA: transposase [Chitinophagaceae bacterium]|nr:transposase [Chitinophagaceae bacterium]
MSNKYKIGDHAIPHFISFSVVGWIDVFTRDYYKEIVVESLKFCQENKGLILHAWVIMTNHVHLIISSESNKIEDIVRDLKKFTSKKILHAIISNDNESRKEWMMNIFKFTGKNNNNNKEYQFWKQDYHPVELNTVEKTRQRLQYLHQNPVKSGLVWEPWHFKYSSAIDYYTEERGLLHIEHL